MRCWLVLLGLLSAPGFGQAETVVPVATIRPNTILTAQDLRIDSATVRGGISDPRDVIGMEARVVLYAGRPILRDNIGAPALVNRNEIVKLVYSKGALEISTTGRALDRGALDDLIRVMNLSSRTQVVGRVTAGGIVVIGGGY